MDDTADLSDEVARSLARKAFAYHMMSIELGPMSGASIRDTLLMVWQDAGSPPGAFTRAARVAAILVDRMAESDEDEDDPLRGLGVSREQQIAIAQQGAAFLTTLARELEG
ncbi:MAG: hypothetical protein EAS51_12495 [Microbacteriaceae bacterium]|nr:MAG: hypothetical protein EAS51_12495 [Microbacteriaceae bacterium]